MNWKIVCVKSNRRQGCHSCILNKVNNFKIFRIFNEKFIFLFCKLCKRVHNIFFVFLFGILHIQNIQTVTTFLALLTLQIVWDLIMVLQLISIFKTLDKYKVFRLKVVYRGSKHILGSLVLVTTKPTLFSKIAWFYISSLKVNSTIKQ